ncbi:hypothetical protein PACTADRAFT_50325 [Pachysolen tannophilus NRRL Y-2460]|uniref:Uncharacterized protein n=1 Tax=Pachysolen tannophilus NRRL Y-2460 TaxID=669874 RepID=A0A1E4TV69_PACTA|nr:hypothetical protein PACTADRAFT_50325 [Pachysolen tannophilus NRRL Y-2460]
MPLKRVRKQKVDTQQQESVGSAELAELAEAPEASEASKLPELIESVELPPFQKIRFSKFEEVVLKALDESLKTLSLEKLKTCYPNIAKTTNGIKYLEAAQVQIQEYWSKNSIEEFQAIYKERNLKFKLDELDELIYEAQKRKLLNKQDLKIFYDKLSPNEIINSQIIDLKNLKIKDYQLQLQALKNENNLKFKELEKIIQESNDYITDIEKLDHDFLNLGQDDKEYQQVYNNLKEMINQVDQI